MKVIDLSTLIYEGMEVYKGDPEVKIDLVHTYKNNTWELRYLQMGSHTGTHVDAFSHMHLGGKTLDEIDIERFMGKAQIVSPKGKFPYNKGLFFIEEVGGEILDKIIEHRPGFVGGNIDADLERKLLAENIITYTRLINLDKIPINKTFMFYGLPLKIKDGDGSPVRAIAILD